jgi:ribonuclease-3
LLTILVFRELQLFQNYFFYELLELWDWQLDGRFFFMPRFVRNLSENGKEILSMKVLPGTARGNIG